MTIQTPTPTPTTSSVGFAARFARMETQFNELRGTVLEAIGDGKLTWEETITLGQQLEAMVHEIHDVKNRLAVIKDSIQARA